MQPSTKNLDRRLKLGLTALQLSYYHCMRSNIAALSLYVSLYIKYLGGVKLRGTKNAALQHADSGEKLICRARLSTIFTFMVIGVAEKERRLKRDERREGR